MGNPFVHVELMSTDVGKGTSVNNDARSGEVRFGS